MKAYEIVQALAEKRSACLVITNNGKKRTARLGYLNARGRMVIVPMNMMAVDSVLRNYQQEMTVSVTTPSTNPKHPMTVITASWGKGA
mgnify:CR=1 FL=1